MSVEGSGSYDSNPSLSRALDHTLIYEGMMAQVIEPRMDQGSQQSGIRLRVGAILLGAILVLQAVASIALGGNIWP